MGGRRLAGAEAAEALAGVEPGAEAEAGTGGELTPTTSAGEAVAEAEALAGVDSAATASDARTEPPLHPAGLIRNSMGLARYPRFFKKRK